MIYGDKKCIRSYFGMNKNMDTALQYLLTADLKKLVKGRNEVDGDNVFINRFDYETLPEPECFFEAHEQYADLHVLLSGSEKIALAAPHTLTETARDCADDFIGYKGAPEIVCLMNAEKFLIALPMEPHMVKLQTTGTMAVEKAVFKIKL